MTKHLSNKDREQILEICEMDTASKAELARKYEVSVSSIQRIARGKSKESNTTTKIASN